MSHELSVSNAICELAQRRHSRECLVVVQAGDGGLQLLSPQGTWQEVEVPRGALLVNLGSLMALWTNGRWRSTLHRVTNPPASKFHGSPCRRFSLAYFHKVNLDAPVQPFASCMGGAPLPPPCMARHLTRQGILYKHRHLPASEASAAYHAELAALSRRFNSS